MFKSALKWLIAVVVRRIRFLRLRNEWGYCNVQWRVLLVNFIFQRVLRINGDTPWSVAFTSRVIAPQNIRIGRNVGKSFAVSGCCYIQGINGIDIGDGTVFSFGVGIVSSNHDRGDLTSNVAGGPVRIGRNCWLGKNAVVLPGVELGDGCIVGAGAVVTKGFPAGSVLAGVPARPISSGAFA
jgi:acetyltransferase-like isoleucine patch superfamily enzyme